MLISRFLSVHSDLIALPSPFAVRKCVPNEIEIKLCVKQWAGEKETHRKLHLTALDNSACSHQMHID